MFTIRKEQIQIFEQAALRNFENRMIEHLRQFAPSHFKVLEEADIRKVIQHGLKRAQSHGFTSEHSVRLYIELMFMLGSGFDFDLQLPWGAKILADNTLLSEVERIDRLYDKAWDYVDHLLLDYRDITKSVHRSRFIEEISKIRNEPDEILSAPAVAEFGKRMSSRLKQVFPNKCEYMGEQCLDRLIQHGIESAKSYGISSERGVVIFISMMFVLGSSFDADPLLPWVSAILNDQAIADPTKRVDQLHAAAIIYLGRWWG